jgi:hypothetical protein
LPPPGCSAHLRAAAGSGIIRATSAALRGFSACWKNCVDRHLALKRQVHPAWCLVGAGFFCALQRLVPTQQQEQTLNAISAVLMVVQVVSLALYTVSASRRQLRSIPA